MTVWSGLGLHAAPAALPASVAPGAPNFVFILADDQSWSGTSVPMLPGEPLSRSRIFRTPALERLATQGVIFSQAYASHCKCESSRAALQMGRTTTSLNAPDRWAREWKAPVSASLANTLKRANPAYRAAHFGKWQWFHSPEAMGYDASDGITRNEDGDARDPADPKLSFSLTARAKKFMETQVQEKRPFFLQLSYYAVHPEAQALAATVRKYEGLGAAGKNGKGGSGNGRGDRATTAAMTEDLDSCVGEILAKIESLG
ncbi:MAG: sulfatase-like hydrolase/transferase, partial [Verrucomicrobiota bacterium]